MRFLLFVFGIALGVAGTLVYSAFATPARAPASTPVEHDPQISVTLGEPLVTDLIKRSLANLGGKPELAVQLRDDGIAVDASVDVLGRRASGTVLLRPVIDHGKLAIAIDKTSLGTLEIPGLEAIVADQINARLGTLGQTFGGLTLTFTGATVERARGLTVTARVDLR